MFGLTKREQRWKAEQKAAETIAGVLVAAVNAKSHRGEEMNKSEQLIACLEGEIAKWDARIVELESQYQRDVFGLNNEGDPIGGDPAGGYANDNARLRAELAAIKAQEPVGYVVEKRTGSLTSLSGVIRASAILEDFVTDGTPLYAAPVSEAKAQGVVMQATDGGRNPRYEGLFDGETEEHRAFRLNSSPVSAGGVDEREAFEAWRLEKFCGGIERLKKCSNAQDVYYYTAEQEAWKVWQARAALSAPAADAGIVDMYRHLQKVTPYRFKKIQDASVTDGGDVLYFHKDRFDAALLADMAAHCAAKGVV